MARRKSTPAPQSQRKRPAALPDDVDISYDAMPVDQEISPEDSTIVVDAANGLIRRMNADGSMSVSPLAPERPKRARKQFDDNLAEDMDEATLAIISNRLLEQIENDIQSRRDWEETAQKGAELLGVKLEEASAEINSQGTISKIKHTGLLGACITSWANSRGELLPVGGPVKVRDDQQTDEDEALDDSGMGVGQDDALPGNVVSLFGGINQPKPPAQPLQPGQMSKTEKRNHLAQALQNDMNHFLTVVDKDYYPDFSRMLMSRGLLGCQFRKVYRDPILKRPKSVWVKGVDLIVSNEATSLTGAARLTERILMRQGVVKRMQKIGHWRDVPLVIPTTQNTGMEKTIGSVEGIDPMPRLPQDQQHTIYECYCELDTDILNEDVDGSEIGFPVPYRVTLDRDSRRILEIRRAWKEGDDLYRRRRVYVKYGHVPGLGFYDWGFVHLIGNPQRGATMIENVLMDTGMLCSFPGGVMAKSPATRARTTEIRPSIGEFHVIDTGGEPISDFVMPWPYKEPSATLKEMGADLSNQMSRIAGMVEMPIGEGMTNVPVGTIMAYIEAVTKVPSAVHKDDHIAQQEEFELLKDLFEEDPESLIRDVKKPRRQWIAAELADIDLIPAADPNVPSQVHRLMNSNMLVQITGMPQFQGIFNQRAVGEQAIRVAGWTNTGEFINPPAPAAAPPPDPKIVAAQMRSQDTQQTNQTKLAVEKLKGENAAAERAQDSADATANNQSIERREALKAHVAVEKDRTASGHKAMGILADRMAHTETLGQSRDQMNQDHLHHTNDHISQAADRAAQTVANDPAGIDTPPPSQEPNLGP